MAGKTIAEQIAALKATRDELAKKMDEVAQKSLDEGRSMNTAEASEFDDAEAQIKTLDADVARLTRLETIQGQKATPAAEQAKAHSEATARSGVDFAQVKTVEKLEPGIAFARYAMCLTASKGNHEVAFRLAERHFPQTESVVKTLKAQAEGANLQNMMQIKATVPAGTTTGETWAAPLVYASNWGGDFINFLRPRSLIGQANFRTIPFNVRVGAATTGGTGYWVGQGKAKPVTSFGFNALTSAFTKVAAITVITEELARFSDPSAETLVRDMLADAVIEAIDTKLFSADPVAAGVSPAGLLNGVTPVAGPATADPDDIRCALLALWAGWDTANLGARPAYYTTPAVARFLAFTRDALGNAAFPGMTATGGTLDGIPVRVSQYLASLNTTGGSPLILVDEAEVYLADDGSVTLDASREATIEMSDTPLGSSSTTVAASSVNPVSMWQTNSIALRAERFIWWGLRRNGAVAYIADFPASC
jgi:HK97 family phage major capsid protein